MTQLDLSRGAWTTELLCLVESISSFLFILHTTYSGLINLNNSFTLQVVHVTVTLFLNSLFTVPSVSVFVSAVVEEVAFFSAPAMALCICMVEPLGRKD